MVMRGHEGLCDLAQKDRSTIGNETRANVQRDGIEHYCRQYGSFVYPNMIRGGKALIPVIHGYARVSKTDRDDRNVETQLRELANHGTRE